MRRYLVGVSVYLLDSGSDNVLLLRRCRSSDFEAHRWEPVSGRAEPGEDLAGAARRETFEETHLRIGSMAPFDTFMLERLPGEFLHGVAFAAAVSSGNLGLSPEHDSSVWVSYSDLSTGRTPRLATGVQETLKVLISRWSSVVGMLGGG